MPLIPNTNDANPIQSAFRAGIATPSASGQTMYNDPRIEPVSQASVSR